MSDLARKMMHGEDAVEAPPTPRVSWTADTEAAYLAHLNGWCHCPSGEPHSDEYLPTKGDVKAMSRRLAAICQQAAIAEYRLTHKIDAEVKDSTVAALMQIRAIGERK